MLMKPEKKARCITEEDSEPDIDTDLICTICASLYLNPIKLKCGHVFCRGCVLKTRHYADRCPLCRAKIEYTDGYQPCEEVMKKLSSLAAKILTKRLYEIPPEERLISNLIHLGNKIGSTIVLNEKSSLSMIIESKYQVHLVYNFGINSIMLYTLSEEIENRISRLRVLRKMASLNLITASDRCQLAVGLIPGKKYIVFRRSISMVHAMSYDLQINITSFTKIIDNLIVFIKGSTKELNIKSTPLYSSSQIVELAESNPTYIALGEVLLLPTFRLQGIRYGYDMAAGELVCASPLCVLSKEKVDTFERIFEKILWGNSGLYVEKEVIYLVSREPLVSREMLMFHRISEVLLNGHVTTLLRWMGFIEEDLYMTAGPIRASIGTVTPIQVRNSNAVSKLRNITTKLIMSGTLSTSITD